MLILISDSVRNPKRRRILAVRGDNNDPHILWQRYGWVERSHQAVLDNPEHSQWLPSSSLEVGFNWRRDSVGWQFNRLQRRLSRNLLVLETTVGAAIIDYGFWHVPIPLPKVIWDYVERNEFYCNGRPLLSGHRVADIQ